MEWSRVKSIMIGVFCIINVFLLISYINTTRTSTDISDDTIQNTVAILSNNNITIKPDIIPRKTQDIRTFEVVNKFETPEAVAEFLWQTAQDEGIELFNPQYVTTDNTSFEYKTTGTDKIQGLNENTALAYAKKIVTRLKLDAGMLLESEVTKDGDNYIVTFHQVYEDNKILDTSLVFELGENGITRIYGQNWLCDEVGGGGISATRAITEILVNFAVSQEREELAEIVDVRLGYFIGDRGGEKRTVYVVPVWRISTDDGSNFYYDARNGDLL